MPMPCLSIRVLASLTIMITAACQVPTPQGSNTLTAEWQGAYGGVPPLDQVRIADFVPAFAAAMAEKLREVEEVGANSEAPDFANTIEALEHSGAALRRLRAIYGIWSSSMSGPEFQPVERELAPKLAAFADQITQNQALFQRIQAVYESKDKANWSAEQQRLAWKYYTDFVRAGAQLDGKAKTRLSAINQELAGLFTAFSQNVLADEGQQFLLLEQEAQLQGLPQSLVDAAANAASQREHPGKWVISNTRSSIQPFLTYAEDRALREQAWRLFIGRGDMGGKHDNNKIIPQILNLRAERARLLGFSSHAHWRLENTMAKTPERAMELMRTVWAPAKAQVVEEVTAMQALAKAQGDDISIEPWDYRFYAEKVRKQRYDLDQNEVKQYLQLEKLREGMFWVAGELFGFAFKPVTDVPVHHPDVRVWQVVQKEGGGHVGLWYFDPYARSGKRSGAWMNAYRSQQRFAGEVAPIVSNNANFVKGKPGDPVLISWDDATTLLHEFGHALHGLASNVSYPSLAGTAVARDFVEFPSQLLEHWLSTGELLQRFALHHQTGKPIPQALVQRMERAATFNMGFSTTEYLVCALVDMQLHVSNLQDVDPLQYEEETLKALGMPKEIVMRHRLPQFMHIFSGDSYSAGYYSYLWSDTLTADAYEAFTEAGGLYDMKVAARLVQHVFSSGNTVDPAAAYRAFRGRDPGTEALMRKRGFVQ